MKEVGTWFDPTLTVQRDMVRCEYLKVTKYHFFVLFLFPYLKFPFLLFLGFLLL
jgi:hypothetical protein